MINVYVANGTDAHLVDSLVASSLAAKSNSPIVFNDTYGDGAIASASINSKLSSMSKVTALGGNTVVPDSVIEQIVGGHYSSAWGGVVTITSVNAINVTTTAGTAPVLPTTVSVNLSDGTTTNAAVNWASMTPSQYATPGTFTVTGTIDNSSIQAIANVTVTSTSIAVTSASVINGIITITLSSPTWSDYSIPIAKPVVTDFAVTASGVTVTPTAISTTGVVVTLTVPTTTTNHPIVYSVSYKGGTPVVANIQVTDAAPNSVEVGQNFNVVLVASTDGGYSWTYTTDTGAVKFLQLTNGALSEVGVVGSGTEEVFTFQPTQAGSFKLHFSEVRSWVGADSSLQDVNYTINVK